MTTATAVVTWKFFIKSSRASANRAALRFTEFAQELTQDARDVLVRSDNLSDPGDRLAGERSTGPVAPHLARRQSILAAEAAVEIGQIAETDVIGDGADRGVVRTRLAKQPMRARKALPDQKFRKC